MAYNSAFNPDALPAHAEPEQGKCGLPIRNLTPTVSHHQAADFRGVPIQMLHITSRLTPQLQDLLFRVRILGNRIYSPPPQSYGHGPRPMHPTQNRPPASSLPPRTPRPGQAPGVPASDNPQDLFPLFRAANASNTGSLSEHELGSALVNGDYTSFDPQTVKMMIRMFDRDGNCRVTFDEFVALWRFLAAWRELFDRFDEDRSGRISLPEFSKALVAFGYRLSQSFVNLLYKTFENKGRGRGAPVLSGEKGGMSFDLFVQACLTLKRMTDVFKKYDEDRDGYITVSFEEFLTGTSILHPWSGLMLTYLR
ncbi:peflin [Coccidioides immitis RMSCC 3703]|uniref:Peflin n=1 Tax=Coccidioides immitis RMSCC 3703 TaxID=454286 RepID=A0A0J8R5Y3_COCIT|nr:peflin [Coccidioides immitis RMSCC 3703]